MPLTIDDFDMSIHNAYAIRVRLYEDFQQQVRLDQASSIPAHTQLINTQAQLAEVDILLGVVPLLTPWAYFFPPSLYSSLRRPPFARAKVAPSLKSTDEDGEEYEKLLAIACQTPEEAQEKATLVTCFKTINKLNDWLGFILGRVGQFLQG